MHIATGFLSPAVAAGCGAIAAGAVTAAVAQSRKTLEDRAVPVVGVLGAFVFAAQMVNFPIWWGTSGHLAGGFLLGLLCGWAPGLLTMTAILTVQSLVFADGGLEALGANIVNMGVVPCLLGGAVRRVWQRRGLRPIIPLSVAGAWLAVVLGSALVVVQFWLSGRLNTERLLWGMTASMVGIHALIGLVEGAITAAVVSFVAGSEVARQFNSPGAPVQPPNKEPAL